MMAGSTVYSTRFLLRLSENDCKFFILFKTAIVLAVSVFEMSFCFMYLGH